MAEAGTADGCLNTDVAEGGQPRGIEDVERRLARLELTLLEVVTAVGMLVGELGLRSDLVLTTPKAVEEALEHGWQALLGVPEQPAAGVTVDRRFAERTRLSEEAPTALAGAVEETGAAVGALYAVDDAELRLLSSVGYPPGVMDAFARFPISSDLPAAAAARGRTPIWFGSREQIVETYPHLRDAHEVTEEAIGEFAVEGAVVPIVAAERVIAVAVIGFTQGQGQDDASRLDAVRLRLASSLRAA